MIILGIVLLVLGYVIGIRALVLIGWVLLGVALLLILLHAAGAGFGAYGWY